MRFVNSQCLGGAWSSSGHEMSEIGCTSSVTCDGSWQRAGRRCDCTEVEGTYRFFDNMVDILFE